ncbi:MAG: hypothetical protein ACYTGX_08215, partial [Planctomycetota bacterium]
MQIEVVPARASRRSAGASGSNPSSASASGVISLVSSAGVAARPASTSPGMTTSDSASITVAPAGTARSGPIAVITPFSHRITTLSRRPPSPVSSVPALIARRRTGVPPASAPPSCAGAGAAGAMHNIA